MRILILGITGMLGNAMFRLLGADPALEVYGTVRSDLDRRHFIDSHPHRIISGIDADNGDTLTRAFALVQPHAVINCIGLVKQLADAEDPLRAVPLNTLLPHRLSNLCMAGGARFVHISTDCVFSGRQGRYVESDHPDAQDLYGRTKLLGEVDAPHAITLRTSIIGRELRGARSLIDWFLSQEDEVEGFTSAVFSGLPTVELSRVVHEFVLPRPDLHGLYHVSAEPISKHDLLQLVARTYGKSIQIRPSTRVTIDRSLDSTRFRQVTGYVPPGWPQLIERMFVFS